MNLRDMQQSQPWTVPYSVRFHESADYGRLPHLYATHAVLHAVKTAGKLAGVFEALDHRETPLPTVEETELIQNMAADLVTAAMRLANLYEFDLETVLGNRVLQKNGIGFDGRIT